MRASRCVAVLLALCCVRPALALGERPRRLEIDDTKERVKRDGRGKNRIAEGLKERTDPTDGAKWKFPVLLSRLFFCRACFS